MQHGNGASIGLLGAAVCLLTASQSFAASATLMAGTTMGTTYQIKFRGDRPALGVEKEITIRLDEINAQMSTYLVDSDVSRFNRAAADEWFPVSASTATVVMRAQEVSRQSDGAFDITVGPLLRLWNFGAEASDAVATLPTEAQIDAVRSVVGYDKLAVRMNPPALRKRVAGLEIDLSAIAKGYAVDEVARVLDNAKLESYMVEIGGEIRVRNRKTEHWNIGVEAPTPGQRRLHAVFLLDEETTSLATSGDYRNFHEIDGKRFSHTIDPKSGRPVTHPLAAISVNSADCISADAYATALMVMGPSRGRRWAEEHQVAAMLLHRMDGELIDERTSQFTLKSPAAPHSPASESNGRLLPMILSIILTIAGAAIVVGVVVCGRKAKRG